MVCVVAPTSIGVLPLQTLSVQYMDLSDQLRVATHPRPARLRRLVQSQLPEAHNHIRLC